MIPGIDVSEYQGTINWDRVAGAGIKFAIIRATAGSDYVDPEFHRNWSEAQRVGLVRGAYHAAYPSRSSGQAQAAFHAETVGTLNRGDLAGALDNEFEAGDLRGFRDAFFAEQTALQGFPGLFYDSPSHARTSNQLGPCGDHGLWLAWWGLPSLPGPLDGFAFVAFWQYTSAGAIPGIGGRVDLDYFNGVDVDHLRAYGFQGGTASPLPHPAPNPTPLPSPPAGGVDYVVRPGDTLSGIAARWGVSLAALEADNPQLGPNFSLIHVGAVVHRPGGHPNPPPPPAPPPKSAWVWYVIQPGDTLSGIAAARGLTWGQLWNMNRDLVADPNVIYPGHELRVPA